MLSFSGVGHREGKGKRTQDGREKQSLRLKDIGGSLKEKKSGNRERGLDAQELVPFLPNRTDMVHAS